MKRSIFFAAILIIMKTAGAQDDSVRTVVLQEVRITAQQKSRQQNLYHFFSADKSATTEDILARLPELSLIRRGSYGMEPVIRSYSGAQINLLLDGMKIHGACTDKMDPASIYIEPINLKSIEVRTNGSSSMIGSSIGGSIDMKLAGASCHEGKNLSAAARSGYHTAARAWYQSLAMNYATAKWGLRATGTYRKSNDYRDGNGKLVPYSQYEKLNYSLHGRLMLKEDTYLKVDVLADDGWNIGYPALPMDVGYAGARIGALSIVKENNQRDWKRMEVKLYANKIRHFMDDTHRPDVPVHMDMPGTSFTSGMYLEGIRSRNSKRQWTIRADAALTSLKASMTMYQSGQTPMYMLTWPDNRLWQSGVAAQYRIRLDSSMHLQFNGRVDGAVYSLTSQTGKDQLAVFGYSGARSSFFIPSFSAQLSRKLSGKLKGAFTLGMNGRSPTASELYGFYLFNQFDGYDYIGNTSLQQEVGQQAELTLWWQQATLTIQATGYLSRINHYIMGAYTPAFSTMTIGAKGVKVYQNTDHAILGGAEASVVYAPFPRAQIISTLRYAWAQDKQGSPLPMIAPLRNTSAARYLFNRFWLQAEYETSAAQNRVNKEANERPTGAFSLYHARIGYQGRAKTFQWELNGGVENIFNAYYREHLDWGSIARPGRNFYLQAGISVF